MTPLRTRLAFAVAILAFGWTLARGQAPTIKDDVGNVFPLGAPPRRVVSLAPNITEILFALGLGDRVVGVTRFCDYPPEARLRNKAGGFIDPDIEKIRALNPDLVIAYRGNPMESIKRLQAFGLAVFVLDIGERLEAVPETISKIGRMTRADAEAETLVNALGRKYAAVVGALEKTTSRPKVFLSLHGGGLMTCGRDSYLNDLIERAKGANAAGRAGRAWLEYSREAFLQDDPDMVIILSPTEKDFAAARAWFRSQPGFASVRAIKNDRIVRLDENAASRFGPRLYDAFADLARLLHPEVFRP
jgi:iron complex transport system substrate-binding protein